jgi:hypothetical protein
VKPTVSQMVHYVSYGTPGGEYTSACRAAVVTGVPADDRRREVYGIGLFVITPDGHFNNRDTHYHEGEPLKPGETRRDLCGNRDYAGGTWHWPERVPDG